MITKSIFESKAYAREHERASKSVVRAYIVGEISEHTSCHYLQRLANIAVYGTDLEKLMALYNTEDDFKARLTGRPVCRRCRGLGHIVEYNGYNTPTRYVITSSKRRTCPVCGG